MLALVQMTCVVNHAEWNTHTFPQTWLQHGTPVALNRTFSVSRPHIETDIGIVCLHGAGGDGAQCRGQLADVLGDGVERVVVAAPDGFLQQWNVHSEESHAPDVAFVEHVAATLYRDYGARQTVVVGFSNGAALTHRLLIESASTDITGGIAVASQLLAPMLLNRSLRRQVARMDTPPWHGAYNVTALPVTRHIVILTGEDDSVVPNEFSSDDAMVVTVRDSVDAYATAINGAVDPRNWSTSAYAYSIVHPQVEAHVMRRQGHAIGGPYVAYLAHNNPMLGIACHDQLEGCDAVRGSVKKCARSRFEVKCARTCFTTAPADTDAFADCKAARDEGRCHKNAVRKRCRRTCCGALWTGKKK